MNMRRPRQSSTLPSLALGFALGLGCSPSDSDLQTDENADTSTRNTGDTSDGVDTGTENALDTGSDAWDSDTAGSNTSNAWVSAYLSSWHHLAGDADKDGTACGNWGELSTAAIDWTAFTHLIYFVLSVEADGSVGSNVGCYEDLNADRLTEIVAAAHANGKPILISVGGGGSYDAFSSAIRPENRGKLVDNIVQFATQWDFDGVDIDMEPLHSGDLDNYTAFVRQLSSALSASTSPLLSKPLLFLVTGASHAQMFAELAPYADQINLMTYDLSGAWPGWITWHNSPIYNGGHTFPSTGGELPCANSQVEAFVAGGVPAQKIGIGIDFYGYRWSGGEGTPTGGATAPRQAYSAAPTVTSGIPYRSILADYFSTSAYRWDDEAKAAYLFADESGSANDFFLSYDDETTCAEKLDYVRQKGIGGVIIWELSGGYLPEGYAVRDPLLQAVKNAASL